MEAAKAAARKWVGDGAQERVFRELPGIFQAAYHDWLTCRRWNIDGTTHIWALPTRSDPEFFAVREFPPPAKPTKLTPNPTEVSFFVLPRSAVEEMFRDRGW